MFTLKNHLALKTFKIKYVFLFILLNLFMIVSMLVDRKWMVLIFNSFTNTLTRSRDPTMKSDPDWLTFIAC